MISFHLTKLSNLDSILKVGLLGSKPKLYHHLEQFQKDGLQGDKVIYTWGESYKLVKYVKDMVYCKQFIHPRYSKVDGYDFSKDREINFRNERYVLLKIDSEENYLNSYTHWQTAGNDRYDTLFNMEEEFEHDDKPVLIFTGKIKPEYIVPIELYDSEVTKTSKLLVRSAGKYG